MCEKGKFSPLPNSEICTQCDTKKQEYTTKTESTKCEVCPAGFVSTLTDECTAVAIDNTLPMPAKVTIVRANASSWNDLIISWNGEPGFKFSVKISSLPEFKAGKFTRQFDRVQGTTFRTTSIGEIGIHETVNWVKVQTMSVDLKEFSQESVPSSTWLSTGNKDCAESAQYLDVSSLDPQDWSCVPCPAGADCSGPITWDQVMPLFGYSRVISDETIPATFERCLFPGACLGAPNLEFAKTYFNISDKETDLSKLTNFVEGCNTDYGFDERSRLCHTCREGYSRVGLHRCKGCPQKAGLNYVFIVLGIIVAAVVLVVLVKMTIDDAGKTKLSESIQKCILNYFQVAALFSNIPLRWPEAVQNVFEVQGAFSTIGEHLVNPDCTSDLSAADLFYAKQIAYLILPVCLIIVVYIGWKLYAIVTGQEWHRSIKETETENRTDSETKTETETNTVTITVNPIRTEVNIKDKFVVTVTSILYLLYPTLCKNTFGLFDCKWIGGTPYLKADLEETCGVGRHLGMMLTLGVGQLIVYVIGLPLVVLLFLRRNRENLGEHASLAR